MQIIIKKGSTNVEPFELLKMERETRFELATSTLARLHSTTELFPLICV